MEGVLREAFTRRFWQIQDVNRGSRVQMFRVDRKSELSYEQGRRKKGNPER